jgi:Ca2+-binding RTX toxin-like protein
MSLNVPLAGGGSAIVFETANGISVEHLDSAGHFAGAPISLTSNTPSWFNAQPLASGGFSVIWNDPSNALVAQDYTASGQASGVLHPFTDPLAPAQLGFTSDATINTATTSTAMLGDGGHVVASIVVNASGAPELHVRQFDAQGAPVGSDHVTQAVAPFSTLEMPRVAALAGGGYVVGYGTDAVETNSFEDEYRLQRYSAGGVFEGETLHGGGYGGLPIHFLSATIVGLPDGGFTASENSNINQLSYGSIYLTEYKGDGSQHLTSFLAPNGKLTPYYGGIGSIDTASPDVRVEASSDGHVTTSWIYQGEFHQYDITEIQPSLGLTSDAVFTGDANYALPTGPHDLVLAGVGDQTGLGNGLDNHITAQSPGDTLSGGAGDDTVAGLGGGNYLRGDDGNDSIQGGVGFDDINGNKGDDTLDGGAGGNDWLVGGQGNDLITAHADQNILYGNLGADTLHGGAGGDLLRGGQGDDVIVGGSGNDWISGDRGSDTLTGGAGADIFHSFSGAGIDLVTDFNASEGDRVQLDPGTSFAVSQSGSDTIVDMGNGDEMILRNVQLSALPAGWIFGS